MLSQKTIAYVSPNKDTTIEVVFGIKVSNHDSIQEILPLLSTLKFNTDLILIDIEKFSEFSGSDVYDIVNSLATLINCTVCRIEPGKPVRRRAFIAVAVDTDTDVTIMKQALSSNIVGLYPRGLGFTLDEKKCAITKLLSGESHIPEKISELIKPKKKTKQNKGIELTIRQEQILTLIKERGSSNKMIARTLDISESTVKLHVSLIFKKFGVKNRTQLAVFSKI
jgi:DNA-binding NarL/FixJ family response regulator